MDKEDIGLVLQRAEAIEREQTDTSASDAEALVAAAVEAGLSREAVEQALREHLALQETSLAVDDLVFAPSTDRCLYVARVIRIDGDLIDVSFVSGSEQRLLREKLRPFSLLPGQTVSANWPNWGWWNCKVVSYDKAIHSVRVTDGWGSEQSFTLANVRLPQEQTKEAGRLKAALFFTGIALTSGGLGSLITWLIMRR